MGMPKLISELNAITVDETALVPIFQGGVTGRTTAKALIDTAPSFLQSGSGAIADTVQNDLRNRAINVLQFIPPALHASIKARTNTTDLTAYIDAADAAACSGALGLDGVTVLAEKAVYFPAGTYKHSTTLTYRGAPWFGDGVNATRLDYYGSGNALNCVGTSSAIKLLNISDMRIYGGNASTGAYGLRLGYNQRSLGALKRVRIDTFPSWGILFDDENWIMSFEDVYVSYCGTTSNAGIGNNAAVGTLNAIDWRNLTVEQCGQNGSAKGGGINLTGATLFKGWNFFGGTWEGNHGAAEARFAGTDAFNVINVAGIYTESALAANGVTNGLVFSAGKVVVTALTSIAAATHTGTAIVVEGTCSLSVINSDISTNWTAEYSVAAGAILYEDKGRTYNPTLTNITNLDGSTAYECMYHRMGSQVTVSGKFDADATAAGLTQLGVSLPVASNLANPQDLAGTGASGSGEVARISGDSVNDRAEILWQATSTVNQGWSFQFTYRVRA